MQLITKLHRAFVCLRQYVLGQSKGETIETIRRRVTAAQEAAALGRRTVRPGKQRIIRSRVTEYFFCGVLASLTGPSIAFRFPPAKVQPVQHDGIRYVAPNRNGRIGYLEAWDINTGAKIWSVPVFKNQISPAIEEDVQWIFVETMRISGEEIIVTDEKSRSYSVELKTGRATPPPPIPHVLPVTYGAVRYIAPNNDSRAGYVEAWDTTTGLNLWTATVFENRVSHGVIEWVDTVFITGLEVRDGRLDRRKGQMLGHGPQDGKTPMVKSHMVSHMGNPGRICRLACRYGSLAAAQKTAGQEAASQCRVIIEERIALGGTRARTIRAAKERRRAK